MTRFPVTAVAILLLAAVSFAAGPATRLSEYRAELDAFRLAFGGARALPDVSFFLFGMGPRTKLLYKSGVLLDARTGKTLHQWDVKSEIIIPSDYSIFIETRDGTKLSIVEDEQGVWIDQGNELRSIEGTKKPVKLPTFGEYRWPQVMRVLHQELLVNVVDSKPVPNFFVYPRPWYRDGAMMAKCFQDTGNLDVIKDWILKLNEVYDRNNKFEREADNLGQALYLISLVSDKEHPLVKQILAEVPKWEVKTKAGVYIKGRSDFAEHPAYQTKWLKYGLGALRLPDPYIVPEVKDSYSALFWMAYKDTYVKGGDANDRGNYPYLGWACDHFHAERKSPISNRDYPLTWEQNASQAKYDGMKIVSEKYTQQKLAVPHTWHAAEVFLYLLEMK